MRAMAGERNKAVKKRRRKDKNNKIVYI